jgi:outer membrane protein OmpA-like peptidoglycan-associated protein
LARRADAAAGVLRRVPHPLAVPAGVGIMTVLPQPGIASMPRFLRLAAAALMLLPVTALAADKEGSADHELVPRYEQSEIVAYGTEAFTEYRLMTAPAAAYGGLDKNVDATLALEGKLTRISYRAPVDRSVLEVFRNYETALAAAGFEAVYSCDTAACGGRNFNHVMAAGTLYSLFGEFEEEQRYLAARLARPEGDVYVALYTVMNASGGGPNKGRAMVQLDLVELQPMEENMVVLDAAALDTELTTEGRVAIYGILFDFDAANIKPESKPQLDELAAMLAASPELQVLVVGHTDGKGALDYNQLLSAQRAEAVVAALAGDYGVAGDRLTPAGAGMLAPVATNRTEEGRAANRRVEIVALF